MMNHIRSSGGMGLVMGPPVVCCLSLPACTVRRARSRVVFSGYNSSRSGGPRPPAGWGVAGVVQGPGTCASPAIFLRLPAPPGPRVSSGPRSGLPGMTMLFQLQLLLFRLIKPFMKPLSWIIPIPRPVLFVGPGSTGRLCKLVGGSGARRTLIVTDAVLAKLGVIEPARQALRAEGIDVAVFDGIVPDPTHDVLRKGLEAVRAHGSDSIVAVGGGSSIDAAKVIAAMASTGKTSEQLIGKLKVSKPPLPLYAVPTTAGTGSEVTVAAVVTDPVGHVKAVVVDPKLVPLAAALDPEMMRGMPAPITAATGMDALTHAVEAYVNRWPHAETPMFCVSAVKLIFANLPRACSNGADLEAREAMALASLYAGLAFTKAYVGYVHAFSHKIGGVYGVPH
ncbi:MAG: iron-containing alcohol dehydrogenase, partial [Gammaproteobacteria bacterium]|nr:iron-containing alcohol dehydrogenase [Gammaproteobacteria bacterium]